MTPADDQGHQRGHGRVDLLVSRALAGKPAVADTTRSRVLHVADHITIPEQISVVGLTTSIGLNSSTPIIVVVQHITAIGFAVPHLLDQQTPYEGLGLRA